MSKQNIFKAINAGLQHLDDKEVRVRSDLIVDLVELKSILIAIMNGQLIIATPDMVKSGSETKKEPVPEQ